MSQADCYFLCFVIVLFAVASVNCKGIPASELIPVKGKFISIKSLYEAGSNTTTTDTMDVGKTDSTTKLGSIIKVPFRPCGDNERRDRSNRCRKMF